MEADMWVRRNNLAGSRGPCCYNVRLRNNFENTVRETGAGNSSHMSSLRKNLSH